MGPKMAGSSAMVNSPLTRAAGEARKTWICAVPAAGTVRFGTRSTNAGEDVCAAQMPSQL